MRASSATTASAIDRFKLAYASATPEYQAYVDASIDAVSALMGRSRAAGDVRSILRQGRHAEGRDSFRVDRVSDRVNFVISSVAVPQDERQLSADLAF